MAHPKAARMLYALQSHEQRRFLSGLQARDTGKRTASLAGLAGWLLGQDPQHPLDREAMHASAFPEQPYRDLRLRHTCAELVTELEDFLVQESLRETPEVRDLLLLQAYRKRGMISEFGRLAEKLDGHLAKQATKDAEHMHHRFLLELERHRELDARKQRTLEPNLETTDDALDAYYLSQKLRLGCYKKNHAGVVAMEYRFNGFDALPTLARERNLEDHPAIRPFLLVWRMLDGEQDEAHFSELVQALQETKHRLREGELRALYLHAINHGIRKMRSGDERYLRRVFSLYQAMLESDCYREGLYMSPFMYKNVAAAGIRLGEAEWVNDFLERYRPELHERFRESTFEYAKAKLAFSAGHMGEVMARLQKVDHEDIFMALDARAMLLKAFYLERSWDALDSLIASFRVFLQRRREVSDDHRKTYLHLVRVVKTMARIRQRGDRKAYRRLQEELAGGIPLSDPGWVQREVVALAARFHPANHP